MIPRNVCDTITLFFRKCVGIFFIYTKTIPVEMRMKREEEIDVRRRLLIY